MHEFQETPLPAAIEAEQSIIGGLLRDNGAVDNMGDLRPTHFYRQDHREIFCEILRQTCGGQGCDVISVALALPHIDDCMRYLNDMAQSCPSAAGIRRHADLVRDRALRRGLLAASMDLTEMAHNPGARAAAEILDSAQSALAALGESRTTREPELASAAMIAHCKVLDGSIEREYAGIATGFRDVDEVLTGGPNRGALVILGARPSMGKTALAMNMALSVARQRSVLVLSMEMSKGELLDRALAVLGRIPLGAVIRGELSDIEWGSFTAANAQLTAMNLHLDDQPALTLLDVRSKARLVKRKYGLDFLVIDYLQLMSGAGDNRNQQIEEISRGLKALAKELDIVVLALSQLSRAAAGRARPQLSDLRDSGAIEQDADVVMFIHRDEVDNPQTHMRGLADLFVAKNRQGRIDDVLLNYQGQFTRFSDSTGSRPSLPEQRVSRRGIAEHL